MRMILGYLWSRLGWFLRRRKKAVMPRKHSKQEVIDAMRKRVDELSQVPKSELTMVGPGISELDLLRQQLKALEEEP
jgi:hypothetical protein